MYNTKKGMEECQTIEDMAEPITTRRSPIDERNGVHHLITASYKHDVSKTYRQ